MFPNMSLHTNVMKTILVISLMGVHVGALIRKVEQKEDTPAYAIDISFPMLNYTVSTNYPWLPHNVDPKNNPIPKEYENMPIQPLGDKQGFYEDYMQGCRDYWREDGDDEEEESVCDDHEASRIERNVDQPPGMVNYTDIGYKKIKCPPSVFKLLADFWEANKHDQEDEYWSEGNVFVNYWDVDAKFVNIHDDEYVGGGDHIVKEVWDAAVQTISEWTGQKLIPSSLYGIRVYKEGAVLSPHVDRLPLISSAIVNVAQDVDEPWALEVIGHDGVAKNVTVSA